MLEFLVGLFAFLAASLLLERILTLAFFPAIGRLAASSESLAEALFETAAGLDARPLLKSVAFAFLAIGPFVLALDSVGGQARLSLIGIFAGFLAAFLLLRIPMELDGLSAARNLTEALSQILLYGILFSLVLSLLWLDRSAWLSRVLLVTCAALGCAGLIGQIVKLKWGARATAFRDAFVRDERDGRASSRFGRIINSLLRRALLDLRLGHVVRSWLLLSSSGLLRVAGLQTRLLPSTEATEAGIFADKIRCRLLYRIGRAKEAQKVATRANRRVKELTGRRSAVLSSAEAIALYSQGELEAARELLVKSHDQDRKNPYVLLNLSNFCWQLNEAEEAVRFNEEAYGLDSECPLALRNHAFYLLSRALSETQEGERVEPEVLDEIDRFTSRSEVSSLDRMKYIPGSVHYVSGLRAALTYVCEGSEEARDLAVRRFVRGIRLEDNALCRIGLACLLLDGSATMTSARYQLTKAWFSTRGRGGRVHDIAGRLLEWTTYARREGFGLSSRSILWSVDPPTQIPEQARDEAPFRSPRPRPVPWFSYLRDAASDVLRFFGVRYRH